MNCLLIIHDGHGGSQEVAFCRSCLDRTLRQNPLTDDEIVIDSEDDCEHCGAVGLTNECNEDETVVRC